MVLYLLIKSCTLNSEGTQGAFPAFALPFLLLLYRRLGNALFPLPLLSHFSELYLVEQNKDRDGK